MAQDGGRDDGHLLVQRRSNASVARDANAAGSGRSKEAGSARAHRNRPDPSELQHAPREETRDDQQRHGDLHSPERDADPPLHAPLLRIRRHLAQGEHHERQQTKTPITAAWPWFGARIAPTW